MFLVDTIILAAGVLLLLGIASSKFSARVGLPVLVLFLGLGMLAGSEGIGGIEFEDYALAHGIGTLALGLILFDGGLRTPLESIRATWKPAMVLATLGVFLTAAVTGWAAAWILGIPLLTGMLLGSIVGSTDAAAVFAVLRSGGVQIRPRLAATLEVESASNDPMAIFLTVGLIEVIAGRMEFGWQLVGMFASQMGLGALVGLGLGALAVWVVNRINLDAAGLYPVLVTGFGLLTFGVAAALGGSGFLAVYLAGIVIGNSRLVFKRGIFLFHDASAWLGQITMFVLLGLLSFPSRLAGVAGAGLLIAAVLIFVARPIAVLLCVPFFGYSWRELTFLSWVGLKGAVPITLATFPFMLEIEGASLLFNVVFFVVLLSAVIQGSTLPFAARLLGLEQPAKSQPPVTLEISSLRHVEGDIVDYTVSDDSRATGRLVKELALPEGVVIALIARGEQTIPPQGNTRIELGDHVIVVLRPAVRPLVDAVFARQSGQQKTLPQSLEFPLRGSIKVRDLEEFYAIRMDAPPDITLDELMRERLGPEAATPGATVTFGPIALHIRSHTPQGQIDYVGMVILPEAAVKATEPPRAASS